MVNPYIGQISMVAFSFPPRGWSFCSGQILPVSDNQALFALLGNAFGGDAYQSFGLPDLRGRVPIGSQDMGHGPNLSTFPRGSTGGLEEVIVDISQLPAHTHIASASGDISSLAAVMPAYNDNGNTLNPGPNVVPAIGNYTSGLTTTQINNYSSNNANTYLKELDISGNMTVKVTNATTGNNDAHYNLQPYLAINFVIALEGDFPPRN